MEALNVQENGKPRTGQEFLTFALGNEEYGIDILKVQEIRGYEKVTQIVNAPGFIKGVINLRGTIVPIIDLRLKFKLGSAEYTPFTVVIILNLSSRVVGVVVDSVSDVIQLDPEEIREAPPLNGSEVDTRFIRGLATLNERMVILMDIETLMCSPDMALMADAA
ncbi:chemotaxis protein CheW [Perlucidibaca piscinae]|uniref:chemotaxis protein CheW n=1 Tax=Perlucidibaca piscinae TaxID=392589 RepID=UPI0012EBD1D3|nr:chemotaxis protein CheW [Perlucidibaca piscinae]